MTPEELLRHYREERARADRFIRAGLAVSGLGAALAVLGSILAFAGRGAW